MTSFQVSALPTSPKKAKQRTDRRSANFRPSIWGDHFLSYASNAVEIDDKTKLQELKEEIKRMLVADMNKPVWTLDLIDAIQRLGVAYHFETEVDEILENFYKAYQDSDLRNDRSDLHFISLRFRLLRQHGYNISCDVFNEFKNSNGNFKESLVEDIRGMLSLYEATHLRFRGENILDDALAFTTSHLELMATELGTPLAEQVKHALNLPLRKALPRLEARYYMTVYHHEPSHNEVLLRFAKLDYNILQKLHQKELSEITKWWKDLDFAQKLPFTRNRVVEAYFWMLGVYFEPKYLLARRILTKVLIITTVIDDIYDVYGTIEELELFTSAIERWDISAIDKLPVYMKICYAALLDIYSENEAEMACQGSLYRLHYAKEAMKKLTRSYLIEAKWNHQNYLPTMDEYLDVALVSGGYGMVSITSFVGMGDIATKEAFEWALSNPKPMKAATILARLMNDIVSHEFEQKRGHVASAIECYMKQYGATEAEACEEFRKQMADAWKDLNEGLLRPTALPIPLLDRILNMSKALDVIYEKNDGYTHPEVNMKDYIASLFIDPAPV